MIKFGIIQMARIPKIIRDGVIDRDSSCCVLCGRQAKEIHHVMLKSHSGNNTSYNLVCVCRVCHSRIHSNNKKWFPILFNMLKKHYPNLTKEMMKK